MSITKKLVLIMSIMAVLITAELAALTVTIKILSAVRAYVGGEGLWSKAQKNASYYLAKYTYTHNEKDYQNYLDFIKIPLSDHEARLALSKNPIDYNSAKEGFSGGGIHLDDIHGIIWLFHRFQHFYYINKAFNSWGQADDLLFELIKQGDELHKLISNNQSISIDLSSQLENIDHINNQLTTIENEFSYTLGEGSRWLENIIFKLLLSLAIIVEFTGILLTTLIGIKISRNLIMMNKVASKVGLSDFSERVIISSKDELGQLAVSFNTMIDDLDKHYKKQQLLEEKFRSILENAPDAMVMINKDGEIAFANTQTEQMFGYKKIELIGQKIEALIPARFQKRHPKHRANYFTNPHKRPMGTGMELFGLRKNGEEFPVEISLSPLDTKDEMVALAAVRDVTERKKMDRLKNEFISVISHELRTPLTSIKGSLDLLTAGMMNDISAFKPQALIKIAKQNSERLVRLINDILDIEKIETGHMEFHFKSIKLNDLLEEAVMANQPYGESFQVKISLSKQQEPIIVDADYDRLIQVLSNLISNAIKFSPPNGEVTVSSTLYDDLVEVAVADNGPGIALEFQPKIFQKFAQADSSLSRGNSGTGLGLSISKAIVEKHGGSIFFKTIPNQGTTFYFNLPIKADE